MKKQKIKQKKVINNNKLEQNTSKIESSTKIATSSIIIAIISIICLSIAIFMTIDSASKNAVCTYFNGNNVSEKPLFSCDGVKQSKYGSIANIPLSAFGIIAFSILIIAIVIMTFSTGKIQLYSQIITILGIICAAISAITLLSIQAFILKQYCPLCLIVDFLSIIMLILIIPQISSVSKKIKALL